MPKPFGEMRKDRPCFFVKKNPSETHGETWTNLTHRMTRERNAQIETWRLWPARVLLPGQWCMCHECHPVSPVSLWSAKKGTRWPLAFRISATLWRLHGQKFGGCGVWKRLFSRFNVVFLEICTSGGGSGFFLLRFTRAGCQAFSRLCDPRSKSNSFLLMRWLPCWPASKTCKRSRGRLNMLISNLKTQLNRDVSLFVSHSEDFFSLQSSARSMRKNLKSSGKKWRPSMRCWPCFAMRFRRFGIGTWHIKQPLQCWCLRTISCMLRVRLGSPLLKALFFWWRRFRTAVILHMLHLFLVIKWRCCFIELWFWQGALSSEHNRCILEDELKAFHKCPFVLITQRFADVMIIHAQSLHNFKTAVGKTYLIHRYSRS